MTSNSPPLADASDVVGASRHFHWPSGLQRAETSARLIVVIGERVLFRDCLVQCLQTMFANHMFLAFATLAAWMEAHICYPDPSIILFCSKGRQRGGSDMVNDVESLCRSMADVPVVVISDIDDGSRIMRMLEKGARGYIPTSMALSVAAEAVRLVEVGGTFAPFSTLKLPCPETDANSSALFTERQIMVVEALRRGKANKQIALELNMRESTVKVHVRRIMKKLNARNRTEVAVMTASMFDEAR